MEAATTIAPTVETAPGVAPTAMEPAATATVETTAATATAVTAAMLGEGRHRQANEHERSQACEKRLQQGGFPHISTPPPKRRLDAREGTPPLLILPSF